MTYEDESVDSISSKVSWTVGSPSLASSGVSCGHRTARHLAAFERMLASLSLVRSNRAFRRRRYKSSLERSVGQDAEEIRSWDYPLYQTEMRDSALKDLSTPVPDCFVPGTKALCNRAYNFGNKPGRPSIFFVVSVDISRLNECLFLLVSYE